jgi:endoglucanase
MPSSALWLAKRCTFLTRCVRRKGRVPSPLGILAGIVILTLFSGCSPEEEKADRTVVRAAGERVFVDQVGYRPQDPKAFVTNSGAVPFEVISLNTGKVALAGETSLRRTSDPATGMDLYWGDFSTVRDEGTYRVRLQDGSESFPFDIRSDVYAGVANSALKSYFLQRCGVPLEEPWAGVFARPACHTDDARFHPSLSQDGGVTTTGGWHDAGDYGKYVHSASVSLAHMLMMYEQFPSRFSQDAVGIPESGNGVPDLLDEMAVALDWMLTMQVEDVESSLAGGVHYMVNTREYEWVTAETDTAERLIHSVSSVATADFAAAMALAARVFAEVPALRERSDQYRSAAIEAWSFLERHPGLYPAGGFIRPEDTHTGGYAESPDLDDRDDRLWAAVELALTIGDARYVESMAKLGDSESGRKFFDSTSFDDQLRWENTIAFPFVQAALQSVPGLDEQTRLGIRRQFLAHCEQLVERLDGDGFGVALESYYWGGTGGALALGQMLLFGHLLEPGRSDFRDGALHQLHYVLGRNGLNTSFVSGAGSRYPRAIHHAVFDNDDLEPIFPGLIAGGPNSNLEADETLPLHFDESTPPALCYVDHMDSWASNENCILYNAPLVAVAFYFAYGR